MVEFWGDDDFGATVLLASGGGGVGGYGIVFTSAACSESGGVNAEVVLQRLHHGGCTKRGEVPVVADIGARDGDVVGVALYQHVVVFIILDDLGNLAENVHSGGGDVVAAAFVKHVVGKGDVDHSFQHFDINVFQFVGVERTGEVVGEHHVEGVGFGFRLDKLFDVFVGGVDFVNEF